MDSPLGEWTLPSLWAMKHRVIRGKPLQFYSKKDPLRHRPWQIAPIDDMHPYIVILKARQMGFTEVMACIKMIHFASMVQSTSVYTMPKWDKAREIARERISPLGRKSSPSRLSDAMISRLSHWSSLMDKHITPAYGGGTSAVLITGSWNEDLGESTAADEAFFDEYDRMRPGVISAFRQSLSASPYGLLRLFSTPTFPQQGVDGMFQQSDKKRWVYTCEHCGHRQYLTRDNILQRAGPVSLIPRLESHDITAKVPDGTFEIGCLKCKRTINRLTAHAEWIAEDPSATEVSGYSASQLDCAWLSADRIMRELRELRPGLGPWIRYVTGQAYLGDSGAVHEGLLYTLVNPEVSVMGNRVVFDTHFRGTECVLGVDWGKTNWYVVLGAADSLAKPHIIEVGYFIDTKDPDDSVRYAVQLAKRWNAELTIADDGYGADRNPKVYDALRPNFFACRYATGKTARPSGRPIWGANPPTASQAYPVMTVGRTPSIKETLVSYQTAAVGIASLSEQSLDLLDLHAQKIVIALEEGEDGKPVETAVTLGPDHLTHAYNYARLGFDWLRKKRPIDGELDVPGSLIQEFESQGLVQIPTAEDVVDIVSQFIDEYDY